MARPNARSAALAILEAVDRHNVLATAAVRKEKRLRDLEPRTSATANELAMGTLRHRRYLDHVLRSRVSRGLPEKDQRLMDVLRLAAYELLFMDKPPEYATVNTFVELARRTHGAKVAGFVNAVLRGMCNADVAALARARADLPPGVRYSFPDWALEELEAAFPSSWERELAVLSAPAAIALRVNTAATTADAVTDQLSTAGLHPRRLDILPSALELPPGEPPYETVSFVRGQFWPQDFASQLICMFVERMLDKDGCELLDACSGSGTKSLCLACDSPSARIVAADIAGEKTAALGRRLAALGATQTGPSSALSNAHAVTADLTSPPFAAAAFDVVLVDAPCTGLGTVRRHPELKWRRKPGDVAANHVLQGRLLHHAARLVKPGGALVYAVCTFVRAEGPDVVDEFLARHPWFRRMAPAESGLDRLPGCATVQGDLLIPPSLLPSDCFFAALLRRTGAKG